MIIRNGIVVSVEFDWELVMKKRLIASAVMVVGLVLLLISRSEIFISAVAVIGLIAVYEICAAYGFNKKAKLPIMIYIMLSVIPVGVAKSGVIVDIIGLDTISLALTVYIMLGFILMLAYNNTVKVRDMFSALLISVVLVYFLSYGVKLRTELDKGIYLVWTVLVGACFTDTFALFAGKFFGKRRLAPKISPNKTVEGSVGGIIGAILMMLVYGFIMDIILKETSVNYPALALLGFVSSIFAQIGDLSLSAIKREAGIKDYGNIIPGHGGVLDRIDSVIFVIPVAYYFILYVPIFL